MRLRSPAVLAVQFSDDSGGAQRSALFVNLPTPLDDLIVQEETRREALYESIFQEGPVFSSANYGRLYLNNERDFLWEDFERLVPAVLPASVLGRGKIEMRLFLPDSLHPQYDGAFTLKLKTINGPDRPVDFLYKIDSGDGMGGLRLEYISPVNIDDNRVLRRDSSPTIIYFYQAD
jgi:hypothetical protein